MSKFYYVDVPDHTSTDPECQFINIAKPATLAEAEQILAERYGMPPSIAAFFITQGGD